MMRVRKISADLFLNLFASFVPLFFLQYIIQPYVASIIGADRYGTLLLILGVLNIGVGIFGSTLNNARLLDNRFYEKVKGDYPLFLVAFCFFNSVFTFSTLRIYKIPLDWLSFSILICASILAVSNSYLVADYRIHLNYKKILASKLLLSVGYGLGLILFQLTSQWAWIFFIGYCLEFIYIVFTTQISREPYQITSNIQKSLRRLLFLILSAALGSVLIYLDRLIIFPVFGGSELSAYYAASIVGKTISLVTGPMAGVLLSYIVKISSITKRQFSLYCLTLVGFGILGYFVCLVISQPLIVFLYPDLLSSSLPYIPYTVVASMFSIFYSFVWPIVLRFGKNSYPLVITLLKAVVYLILVIALIRKHGVLGVALASLFASAAQSIAVFFFGLRIAKNSDTRESLLASN